MMREEFEKLTGIYVPEFMYQVIENVYLESEVNKQDFCDDYKNNQMHLAERIQRLTNEAYMSAVNEAKKEHKKDKERIKQLEDELDRELEWKPYPNSQIMSDAEYQFLRGHSSTKVMSIIAAREYISQEFGFRNETIQIIFCYQQEEINRHGVVRKSKKLPLLDRTPCYVSSDWNYVLFECCGYMYECKNGELKFIC